MKTQKPKNTKINTIKYGNRESEHFELTNITVQALETSNFERIYRTNKDSIQEKEPGANDTITQTQTFTEY